MENGGENVCQEETNNAAIHSEAASTTGEAIASASSACFPDESLASTVEALNVQEIHDEEKIEEIDNGDDNIFETERRPSPLPNGDIENGRQPGGTTLPRLRAAVPVAHEHAEVEPEVDIEEVVLDRNAEPSVSMLTTSLMESEKQDIPPAIPTRAAFASAPDRPTSEGRGTPSNRHNATASRFASTGAPAAGLPLPDFKAQVNSRSFLQVNDDDLRVDGRVVEPSDDARTVSVVAQQLTDDSSPPVQVAQEPPTTRQISNGTSSNSTHHHSPGQQQEDGDIPVVAAVLVPQERLEAEHRHRSDGQESGSTSLSTNESESSQANNNNAASSRNNNNNSNNNGESTSRSKSTRSGSSSNNSTNERRFWITLIIAALVLNSLLVTGVVVASFCAAGKCSPKSASDQVTDEGSADGMMVPTPSMALTPTAAPSYQQPSHRLLSDSPTGWPPSDVTNEADPPNNNSTWPTLAPPTASLPTPQPTEEDAGQRPAEGFSAKDSEEEDSGSGVPLVVMEILLALAAEVVILGSLYLYYRWWRKRQRKLQEVDQGAQSTTSSCPNLDVGETNDDDEEQAERSLSEP